MKASDKKLVAIFADKNFKVPKRKNSPYKFKVEIKRDVCDYIQKKKDFASPVYHYWAILKGRNGEIVFTGETRKSKSGLIKTINNLFPGVVITDKTK